MTCPRGSVCFSSCFPCWRSGLCLGMHPAPHPMERMGSQPVPPAFSRIYSIVHIFSHPSPGSGDRLMAQCQGDSVFGRVQNSSTYLRDIGVLGALLLLCLTPLLIPSISPPTRLFFSSSALPLCATSNFSKPFNLQLACAPRLHFLNHFLSFYYS